MKAYWWTMISVSEVKINTQRSKGGSTYSISKFSDLFYLYSVIFQQIDTPWTRMLRHYYLMFYMGHLYKLHIF